MGSAMSKIEFTSWKIFITFTCVPAYFHHYYFLWSTRYVIFSHTKFQIAINICHLTFLQCVWIKPHSFSLPNLESSESSFRQSVHICCSEEQKEENDGNCKAFCVTRKPKKQNQVQFWTFAFNLLHLKYSKHKLENEIFFFWYCLNTTVC